MMNVIAAPAAAMPEAFQGLAADQACGASHLAADFAATLAVFVAPELSVDPDAPVTDSVVPKGSEFCETEKLGVETEPCEAESDETPLPAQPAIIASALPAPVLLARTSPDTEYAVEWPQVLDASPMSTGRAVAHPGASTAQAPAREPRVDQVMPGPSLDAPDAAVATRTASEPFRMPWVVSDRTASSEAAAYTPVLRDLGEVPAELRADGQVRRQHTRVAVDEVVGRAQFRGDGQRSQAVPAAAESPFGVSRRAMTVDVAAPTVEPVLVREVRAEGSDGSASEATFAAASEMRSGAGVSSDLPIGEVTGATARSAATEMPHRVIDQIVKDVRLLKLLDGTNLTIRLRPAELGTLQIRVVSDAQGLTSQIEASSPQTRSLLQAHVPLLMDSLAAAGVRVDSVSVTATPSFSAWTGDMAQQQFQQQYAGSGRGRATAVLDPAIAHIEQSAILGAQDAASHSWLA